jgi:hypothetical protein
METHTERNGGRKEKEKGGEKGCSRETLRGHMKERARVIERPKERERERERTERERERERARESKRDSSPSASFGTIEKRTFSCVKRILLLFVRRSSFRSSADVEVSYFGNEEKKSAWVSTIA